MTSSPATETLTRVIDPVTVDQFNELIVAERDALADFEAAQAAETAALRSLGEAGERLEVARAKVKRALESARATGGIR